MIGGSLVYLLIGMFHDDLRKVLITVIFAVASVAFLFTVNFAFNNVLEPHQQMRIKVVLGIEDDPRGAGYNVNQSKIAIGSGGLTGKGFLNGTQTKLKYVPEQHTDFIFCTIGEEQGFVGSVGVLLLFWRSSCASSSLPSGSTTPSRESMPIVWPRYSSSTCASTWAWSSGCAR